MEKKNKAGYLTGLITTGTGVFIGGRGAAALLVALNDVVNSGVIGQLPVLLQSLPAIGGVAGGVALGAIGIKGIINTYRGNKKIEIGEDVKEIKRDVGKLREELSRGIEKTPTPTLEQAEEKMAEKEGTERE